MHFDETPLSSWFEQTRNETKDDIFSLPYSPTITMNDLDSINFDSLLQSPIIDLSQVDLSEILDENYSSSSFTDLMNSVSIEDILEGLPVEHSYTPNPIDISIEDSNSTEISIEYHCEEYLANNDSGIESSSENEDNEPIGLSEEYENHLIFNKQSIHGIYFLSRKKPYLFSLYYNKTGHVDSNWILHISLESENKNPKKLEKLESCKKAKHDDVHWFSCNNVNVRRGDSLQIPLSNNRINKELSITFYCNNSCSSMYSKSKLRFQIFDSNDVICLEESFSIHVSERPARDGRELLKENILSNNIPKSITHSDYLNYINVPDLINKEVPKLIDYTNKNCKFEIALDNYEFSNGKNFSACIGSQIAFKVTEATTPYSDQSLYLRCMIVDPKSPESPILCKHQHGIGSEMSSLHILSSIPNDFEIKGTKEGIYADERLSILIPLKSQFFLYFKCSNACFLDRNRTHAGLVVILENAAGEMFARRHFKFAIVSRPNRNKLNFDDDDDDDNNDSDDEITVLDNSKSNTNKRKSTQNSDSPTKRRKKC